MGLDGKALGLRQLWSGRLEGAIQTRTRACLFQYFYVGCFHFLSIVNLPLYFRLFTCALFHVLCSFCIFDGYGVGAQGLVLRFLACIKHFLDMSNVFHHLSAEVLVIINRILILLKIDLEHLTLRVLFMCLIHHLINTRIELYDGIIVSWIGVRKSPGRHHWHLWCHWWLGELRIALKFLCEQSIFLYLGDFLEQIVLQLFDAGGGWHWRLHKICLIYPWRRHRMSVLHRWRLLCFDLFEWRSFKQLYIFIACICV